MTDVRLKIVQYPGFRGSILKHKADTVFRENNGISAFRKILTRPYFTVLLREALFSSHAYVQIVFVDVECGFPVLLSDRRRIVKHLVVWKI